MRAPGPNNTEDKSSKLTHLDWDHVDFHKKFRGSREYGPFEENFGKLLDGPANIYHANLSPHPPAPATASSRSPVTECLTLYHPIDADTAAFDERWSACRSMFEQHAEGYKASSTGWVIEELEYENEKCKAFAIFLGWESVEAHIKFRDTDHFKKWIVPLGEGLKGITACHATMVER